MIIVCVNSGYYAYTQDETTLLSDTKYGSAEIGTCADTSGSDTNLSFTLAVQKGTENVWNKFYYNKFSN